MCYTDSVKSVGVDDGKVPPVPIPNTEVKGVRGLCLNRLTNGPYKSRRLPIFTRRFQRTILGTMCKWSDPFSKRVLIGRGLDHNSLETLRVNEKM